MRKFAFALFALLFSAHAANAMVLSCFPAERKGVSKVEAYVDGFAEGEYPPQKIETIRVLARFGEDVYEFFPEQTKLLDLRGGMLQIHMMQPLSAGETAEVRFTGKIAPKKGEPFTLEMYIRNERRAAQGTVRCTIE